MSEVVASTGVIVPSSPVDRVKLKNQLSEAVVCLELISAQREQFKNIINEIHEGFDIPKKTASKLARTMHKRDFDKVMSEVEDFETLYETIVENASQQAQ